MRSIAMLSLFMAVALGPVSGCVADPPAEPAGGAAELAQAADDGEGTLERPLTQEGSGGDAQTAAVTQGQLIATLRISFSTIPGYSGTTQRAIFSYAGAITETRSDPLFESGELEVSTQISSVTFENDRRGALKASESALVNAFFSYTLKVSPALQRLEVFDFAASTEVFNGGILFGSPFNLSSHVPVDPVTNIPTDPAAVRLRALRQDFTFFLPPTATTPVQEMQGTADLEFAPSL